MRTCSLVVLGVLVAASSAHADTVTYADSTNPLAFFQLQSQSQGSSVNGYTTTYQNGAANVSANGGPESSAVLLNGNNSNPQYVSTSLSGGIDGAGSISAYINLGSALTGGIEYIAGESQYGDDLDFQLSYDNSTLTTLCMYSQSGNSTCANIDTSALVGNWNMVTATFDSSALDQDLYLNGTLIATSAYSGSGQKNDQFTIGYSTVFGDRDFDGLVNDVGIWNYQLSGDQVADLYAAGQPSTPSPSATPEPSSLMLLGTGILGAAGALRRRMRLSR